MKTTKFKTTLKCDGCKAKVTPFLNKVSDISKWEIDLDNPNRLLTVEGDFDENEVIKAVTTAGYKIEKVSSS
jgi:copper chaperone